MYQREAQAPLGPIVRSLTSSGVLSRMSWAYLRSILSSLACVARRVDRVREPPWIPSPRLCSQVEGPSRTRTRNLRVEEGIDLPRLHAGREVVPASGPAREFYPMTKDAVDALDHAYLLLAQVL